MKSMRQRTASAACRSDNPSKNCSTQTVASWAGERPGRPSRGYQSAKSSSFHSPSRRSRTHIAVVPAGLLARATRAVRDGTCSPERGRSDNGHLGSCIGLRNSPSMPDEQAAAPGNTKITDRVKLRDRSPPKHPALSPARRNAPQARAVRRVGRSPADRGHLGAPGGNLTWTAERCTAGERLHGGALMTLADSVEGVCAYLNLPPGATTSTIESKSSCFRGVSSGQVTGTDELLISNAARAGALSTTCRPATPRSTFDTQPKGMVSRQVHGRPARIPRG